jgi:hypothetical protein
MLPDLVADDVDLAADGSLNRPLVRRVDSPLPGAEC